MKAVALIGLGMVADTHLAALRDAPALSLSAVMGRDPEKTHLFAEKARGITGESVSAYHNINALVDDSEIDFVILATPPDARLEYVNALTSAGKPILMEKPIERNLSSAREIVRLCEVAGTQLGVVFQHRARAASLALKNTVERGELGTITSAEIRVPWWRDQSYYDVPGRGTRSRDGGGVMITQAIHTLDLALWLLGPIDRLQALMHKTALHRLECEDWAGALFETMNGCVGSLIATTAAFPGDSETITLHGTAGSAHLEAGTLKVTYSDGRTDSTGETADTGGGADPMAFTHAWHQSVIENFANCLDSSAKPLASGREALMSHAVIDAMERSSNTGTWAKVDRI